MTGTLKGSPALFEAIEKIGNVTQVDGMYYRDFTISMVEGLFSLWGKSPPRSIPAIPAG